MIATPEIDLTYGVTDGDIAVNNLDSARRRSWNRFWRDPLESGVAGRYIAVQLTCKADF